MSFRSRDFHYLEYCIANDKVRVFPSAALARDAAVSWKLKPKDIIKLDRRFERVWVVAKHSTDHISKHMIFDVLHIYSGFWHVDPTGLMIQTSSHFRGCQGVTRKL